jgi:hypothetical protein
MIKIAKSISTSRLDDELVLLDMATGKYFGLNRIGSRIFQLLSETGDEEAVLATLLTEYDAPEKQLWAGIIDLVGSLSEKGIIVNDAQ